MRYSHMERKGMLNKIKLLSQELLIKTGPVDHADWNYRPLLGLISRTRFRLVRDMMRGRRFQRLLEIGYGSGVLMPELAQHAEELHGVDIHPHTAAVSERLEKIHTHAHLHTAHVTSLPFPDGYFDCIVGVSVFEFVDDLDSACDEIERVLNHEGVFLVVTPNNSPILDAGLKLLTRQSANKDFGDRRKNLIPTLLRHFSVVEERPVPRIGASVLRVYTGLKLCRRAARGVTEAQSPHPLKRAG